MSVSVREVAEAAGVSVGTVSNVLNSPEKVSSMTRERVLTAIKALNFVRNDAARQLRAGSSRSIGLVVLDVRNPFFTDLARGVEERAAAAGLSVLLANSDERIERERAHIDLFEHQRVRGLLISPVTDDLTLLQRLRARQIPSVLVDRFASAGWSGVSVDDVLGGRLAVEHLLVQGRRKILFVGGPLHLPQISQRLEGARHAVESVAGAQLQVLPIAALQMRQGVDAGRQVLALPDRPDAVFAANDLVALGVLQGVALHDGLRVPQDIAIVGYDDIDFAAAAAVPITSVRQPREEMGRIALELLLREIDGDEGGQQIVLKPALVRRASSAV